MRPLPLAAALLAVFVLPAIARADDWSIESMSKRESAWKGHGVGSTITETTTVQMPAMPNVPNMPAIPGMTQDGKMITIRKETLKEIKEDAYVLEVETTRMGRTTTSTRTEPMSRSFTPKMTDTGPGSVTIEGQSYACATKSVTNIEGLMGDTMPQPGQGAPGGGMAPKMSEGKVYIHETLGMLRMEMTMSMMGQAGKNVLQVTRLSVPRTVGTTQVTCREMTMDMDMGMGKISVTMLVAPSIPGTVRSETKSQMMGHSTTSLAEVTAYEKKPLPVLTR